MHWMGGGVDEEPVQQDSEDAGSGGIEDSPASMRTGTRLRWTSREEEVAARLAEIERVRARLRVVERERDEELAAQRMEQERPQRMRANADNVARVQADEEEDEMARERQSDVAIEQQVESVQAASAAERQSDDERAEEGHTGPDDDGATVSDMQGELATM